MDESTADSSCVPVRDRAIVGLERASETSTFVCDAVLLVCDDSEQCCPHLHSQRSSAIVRDVRVQTLAMARARQQFTSPFAPLQLTPADNETIEQLSRIILHNYVAQYEAFERDCVAAKRTGERAVDERVWKPVRQKDNVRAFVQRKDRDDGSRAELAHTVERHSTTDGGGLVAPPDLPVMLVEGSIPGTLDDLMYGLLGHSMDTVRVRTSYIDDNMRDGAVLATLALPTEAEPLNSLVIRWVHNESVQGVLRTVIDDRDYVYMERTGIAVTTAGESIGFHLLHSVNFPQTTELPGLTRGNCSVCGIYRSNTERNHVELYVRAIADARGSMLRPVVVLASADTYLSVAKYIESAHCKKLVWHLRKAMQSPTTTANERIAGVDPTTTTIANSDTCVMCNRVPSRTAGVLRGDGTRKRQCALCGLCVCASCRIKKTLSEVVGGKLEQRKVAFCCFCYGDACRTNALDVARHDVAARSDVRPILMSTWSECPSTISSE